MALSVFRAAAAAAPPITTSAQFGQAVGANPSHNESFHVFCGLDSAFVVSGLAEGSFG